MTICVAAICDEYSRIIGASDRMLTAGDIQFQPQAEKLWTITNSIVCMVAGDLAVQTEIYQDVYREVGERIKSDPTHWQTVKSVGEIYVKYYFALRSKRAEAAILAPLGLSKETYIDRQRDLSPGLSSKIATELLNFSMPEVGVIIAGRDELGLHLYVVENGEITCRDRVGFAAIGAGYWHANSQLMFAGHTAGTSGQRALTTVFAAKKRAEVAPGVGTATDMFMIGPNLGSYFTVDETIVENLGNLYRKYTEQSEALFTKHEGEVNEYIKSITQPATSPVQTITEPADGKSPTDGSENRGVPAETGPKDESKDSKT